MIQQSSRGHPPRGHDRECDDRGHDRECDDRGHDRECDDRGHDRECDDRGARRHLIRSPSRVNDASRRFSRITERVASTRSATWQMVLLLACVGVHDVASQTECSNAYLATQGFLHCADEGGGLYTLVLLIAPLQ
jgi:hypothetical protein